MRINVQMCLDLFFSHSYVYSSPRYSTGPKIKPADLQIHEIFRKYTSEPIFIIMEVQPKDNELPMEA